MKNVTLAVSLFALFMTGLNDGADAAINDKTTDSLIKANYGSEWRGGAVDRSKQPRKLHTQLGAARDLLKKVDSSTPLVTLLDKMIKYVEYFYWVWDYSQLNKKFQDVRDVWNTNKTMLQDLSSKYGTNLQSFVNALKALPRPAGLGTAHLGEANVLGLTEEFYGIIDTIATTLDPAMKKLEESIQPVLQTITTVQSTTQQIVQSIQLEQQNILKVQSMSEGGTSLVNEAKQNLETARQNAETAQTYALQAQQAIDQAKIQTQSDRQAEGERLIQQAQTTIQQAHTMTQLGLKALQQAQVGAQKALQEIQIQQTQQQDAQKAAAEAAALKAATKEAEAKKAAAAAAAAKKSAEAEAAKTNITSSETRRHTMTF